MKIDNNIRYCEGQLLLFKAPPAKIKLSKDARIPNGFYIMLERKGKEIILCPLNKKNELTIHNKVYVTTSVWGRCKYIEPSVINFRHKIIPSLIPKN